MRINNAIFFSARKSITSVKSKIKNQLHFAREHKGTSWRFIARSNNALIRQKNSSDTALHFQFKSQRWLKKGRTGPRRRVGAADCWSIIKKRFPIQVM